MTVSLDIFGDFSRLFKTFNNIMNCIKIICLKINEKLLGHFGPFFVSRCTQVLVQPQVKTKKPSKASG